MGVRCGSALGLLTLGLMILAVIAPRYARPLAGNPAALYLLYDETQAPRWVVTLIAFPMNLAANQRWGSDSVIVAPINRQSLREALAHGKIVYLATHGVNGPMLYREGSLGPQDVAQGMPVGPELRLVYLAACHGGDMANQWKRVLAPAEVVSYPRFSAYVEHAFWLWIRLPRYIGAQHVPQARAAVDRHMTRFRQASGLCRYPLAVQIFTARNLRPVDAASRC